MTRPGSWGERRRGQGLVAGTAQKPYPEQPTQERCSNSELEQREADGRGSGPGQEDLGRGDADDAEQVPQCDCDE